MDEKSTRVDTTTGPKGSAVDEKPAAEVNRLRTEIEDARDGLGVYVSELDRRRHEALDLKLQLKRHPAVAIGVAVVTVAAVAGAVHMMVRSRRAGRMPPWRIGPFVAEGSNRLRNLLLGTSLGLRAARNVIERVSSLRARLA
jgi:hypothetical protein